MKIGLILECQFGGPDEKVFKCLLTKFAPTMVPRFSTEEDKIKLFKRCGTSARRLFADGCEHVFVVWDFHPADWGTAQDQRQRTPCLLKDCKRIFKALDEAGVERDGISLIPVNFMLEPWLLADKKAILNCLEKLLRKKIRMQLVGKDDPQSCPEPKVVLGNVFERCGYTGGNRSPYRDFDHAHKIAEEITRLNELNRSCPTFLRFWNKIASLQSVPPKR